MLLDFTGTKKTHTLSKNEGEQRVTITIQKDRAIKFYINGKLKQTAKASVPASVFPVDFEISSADSRGPSVLGSWVGARRLSHLSLFLTASRMVLPQDPSTGLAVISAAHHAHQHSAAGWWCWSQLMLVLVAAG